MVGGVNPDPIVGAVLFQVYYRQLGVVSIHIGIKDVMESVKRLQSERGGEIVEVLRDRVFQWRDVEAFPGTNARVNVWIFGSDIRQKNTLFLRVGFWKLWFIDLAVARLTGRKVPEYFPPTIR